MNIFICDDEKLYLTSAQEKINAWAAKSGHGSDICIYTFTSSEDMLDEWHHGLVADAMFLDILIPNETNGLATAKEIHGLNEFIPIVFMTDYSEYATEGYKVNALRFLHKPITSKAIDDCMDLIWHQWSLQSQDCILLDMSPQILRLPINSILYLEMQGHYCCISTTSNVVPSYSFKLSFRQIQDKLPPQLFVQCHRSFIVNLQYVRHMGKGIITMSDNSLIPISRSYQRDFVEHFRDFYIGGRYHAAANP